MSGSSCDTPGVGIGLPALEHRGQSQASIHHWPIRVTSAYLPTSRLKSLEVPSLAAEGQVLLQCPLLGALKCRRLGEGGCGWRCGLAARWLSHCCNLEHITAQSQAPEPIPIHGLLPVLKCLCVILRTSGLPQGGRTLSIISPSLIKPQVNIPPNKSPRCAVTASYVSLECHTQGVDSTFKYLSHSLHHAYHLHAVARGLQTRLPEHSSMNLAKAFSLNNVT